MTNQLLDLGIPAAVLVTLWKLHEHEFTQREIAELLGISTKSVSRALARLEKHQIVRRDPVPSGPRKQKYGRALFVYRCWTSGPMIGGR